MKDDIRRKIDQRAERFKKIRTYTDRTLTPKKLVLLFLSSVEELSFECKDAIEYDSKLTVFCDILEGKISTFDPHVHLEVLWNNSKEEADFKKLLPTGVMISWSESYLKKNPDKNAVEIIDVADILLDD